MSLSCLPLFLYPLLVLGSFKAQRLWQWGLGARQWSQIFLILVPFLAHLVSVISVRDEKALM